MSQAVENVCDTASCRCSEPRSDAASTGNTFANNCDNKGQKNERRQAHSCLRPAGTEPYAWLPKNRVPSRNGSMAAKEQGSEQKRVHGCQRTGFRAETGPWLPKNRVPSED